VLEHVLLVARTMRSLYSCLRGFVCPYSDAMTPLLLIASLQSCHAVFAHTW